MNREKGAGDGASRPDTGARAALRVKKRHSHFFAKGDRAGCGLLGEGAVEERSDLPAGAVRGEGGAEAPPLNVWGISSLE